MAVRTLLLSISSSFCSFKSHANQSTFSKIQRYGIALKVVAIIRSVCALLFMTQIDLRFVASTSWPNVARQMTY
jgi:hypothetical protein